MLNFIFQLPLYLLMIISNFWKCKARISKNTFFEQIWSETTTQPRSNNLDYLIDLTFKIINRLFVLSFKNGNDDSEIDSFDVYQHAISRNQRF